MTERLESKRARQSGAALATAAVTAAAGIMGAAAQRADAGLMMDVRAVALNGNPMTPTKDVLVSSGDVVTLDLFAVVTGTNGINDDAVQDVFGSMVSSGALLGNLAGGRVAPFTANGSQDGSVQDLDGDTDLDIGAPVGSTQTAAYFIARSTTPTLATPINANSGQVRVGSFTFTVSSGGADVFLNFVRRSNASGGNIFTGAIWFEDGAPRSPLLSPYGSGVPVHVFIPEPVSAATVAGLASLGLLARRRAQ